MLTVTEAAARLGVTRTAVLQAVAQSRLQPAQTIAAKGRVLAHLFEVSEIDRYAQARRPWRKKEKVLESQEATS